MRQSRSPKQDIRGGLMEMDKLKEDQQPHISGAYIRCLVKQLRTKDPINPNDPNSCSLADVDGVTSQNLPKMAGNLKTQPNQQPPQQHKKQVRRRLHTSRPYQERLLNMAEARREIVTALKFHRAAMKKAAGEQQQQQPHQDERSQTPPEPPLRSCFSQEGKIKSRKIPKTYPSSSTENLPSNYLPNLTYNNSTNFCYPSIPSNSFTWSPFQIAPQSVAENLDIALPEQTLGLNLNFHDFNNLDASLFQNGSASYHSNSSSSSSPSLSIATDQGAPNSMSGHSAASDITESNVGAASGSGGGGLHVAVGDEEMAEIRSIGEKHEMEWSDKMNLVTSAWWFRFLKSTEIGKREEDDDEDGYHHPFDQVLEFPDWLNNGNESCLQQQLFNDYCSDDYRFHDPALPCMDIGEFEGMDGEWLA